jgi:tetratricopeptide (TPR) repeat protein
MNKIIFLFLAILCTSCATTTVKSTSALNQELDTEAFAWLESADFFYGKGQLTESERFYNKILKRYPNFSYGWFRLGNIHTRVGQWDSAVEDYQKVIKLEPTNGKAWHNMALVRVKKSILELEESKRFFPEGAAERERLVKLQEQLLTAIR